MRVPFHQFLNPMTIATTSKWHVNKVNWRCFYYAYRILFDIKHTYAEFIDARTEK